MASSSLSPESRTLLDDLRHLANLLAEARSRGDKAEWNAASAMTVEGISEYRRVLVELYALEKRLRDLGSMVRAGSRSDPSVAAAADTVQEI